MLMQGSQFAIGDVEVVTATVDLDEVVSYRGAVSSLQEQASNASPVPTISVDFDLCHPTDRAVVPSAPIEPRYHLPEEEIALGDSLSHLRADDSMCSMHSHLWRSLDGQARQHAYVVLAVISVLARMLSQQIDGFEDMVKLV